MDTIDRATILRIAGEQGWPSVSIYVPTHRRGVETEGDRTRLRNLVAGARSHLVKGGVRSSEADALLERAAALAEDDALWAGGFEGLAVFASKAGTERFRLDTTVPERVVTGTRHYIRPLLQAYHGDLPFWAVALDKNGTRLFRGDLHSIDEVPLPPHTPVKLEDETKYDVHDEALRYHTVPGQGTEQARGVARYHGHGGEKDVDKVELAQYMTDLSRGVTQAVGAESHTPLVLLGVEYMIDGFRATDPYRGVACETIVGATGHLAAKDIHAAVITALAPRLDRAVLADVAEYAEKAGTGLTSADAEEILLESANGRVKTLLLDEGAGPWGLFDREVSEVRAVCTAEPAYLRDTADPETTGSEDCGWDLVDLAAVETLQHGGSVHAFTGEASPVTGAAAVFRY
jgi:hypothetical protein